MNDQHTPQDAAFADTLNDLAERTTPNAAFADSLEARLRQRIQIPQGVPTMNTVNRPRIHVLRPLATAAAALVLMTILTLTVPPLRSFAQDLLNLLFNRTPADTIVYETPAVIDIQPTAVGNNVYVPSTSIEAAEAQAGFDVLVPSFVPEGYTLIDAAYDAVANQTSLMYVRDGIALVIVQIPATSAYPLNVGASADIASVQIGTNSGEYVEGNWLIDPQVDGNSATVSESYWDGDYPFQQLRWQDGDTVFWMMSAAGQRSDLTLDEWVAIAESLQ